MLFLEVVDDAVWEKPLRTLQATNHELVNRNPNVNMKWRIIQ